MKKLASIVIDVPADTHVAETLGGKVFGAAGIEYEVILAGVGTADITPQLQQATNGRADAVGVMSDDRFCTSLLQAYETVGLLLSKCVISVCDDASVIEAPLNALDEAKSITATGEGTNTDVHVALFER